MKIEFYGLREREPQRVNVDAVSGLAYARCTIDREPDLEHELFRQDAVVRAKAGQVVLVKVWLRTAGPADVSAIERAIASAVEPLGLV